MIEPFIAKFLSPTKAFRRFSVLMSIYHEQSISQQQIGERTHLSSSMVNNYIKQLKDEGKINVRGTTNRNQTYHLTATGHHELIESLIHYSAEVIRLYGNAKLEFARLIGRFYEEGIRTVVLFGAAETAEVVYAAIRGSSIKVIGLVDSDLGKQGKRFEGLTIQPPDAIRELNPDAIIVTSFGKQEEICRTIQSLVGDSIPVKRLSTISDVEEAA